jgi:gamma-glutamyl:cysteine ligase YbdK (ATP-grasp superfamily)
MALRSGVTQILRELPGNLENAVKPELFQCYIEINTKVCESLAEAHRVYVLGITALVQCLVHDLSEEIDRGTYQFDCHPFLIRQNKWRACRYGMDAQRAGLVRRSVVEEAL